jgi:MFS family permease
VIWDIRVPFIVHGILSLISIIPSYRVIRETAPAAQPRAQGERTNRQAQSTMAALLVYSVLIFFVAQLLASLTRGTLFSGTVNLYPVYWYGIGAETLGIISTLAGAIGVPIVFSTGAIMDRFGRKKTVVPGFVLLSFALVLIAATAFLNLPFEAFVAAFLLMHAAQNITSGNMQVIGSDIAPAHVRGKFFGVWRTIGEIGQVASPVAFAFLAEGYSYGAAFIFLSVTAMATALVLGTQVKEPLRRQVADGPAATPSRAPG